MYQASSAFHTAVANGAPQKALLVFEDAIFSNADIDVDAGIEMDDYFNTEEDIAIGQALSNEIRFSLFNDDRLLNDYEFGEFTATIGARISTEAYEQEGNVTVFVDDTPWAGYATYPYLKRNGSAVSSQPSFPVQAIAVYEMKVYVFGNREGEYKIYNTNGTAASGELNGFMQAKGARLGRVGVVLDMDIRSMMLYRNGVMETYEFVPLGKFIAKRPNVPDMNLITFTCHDFMTKFDKDMPDRQALGITYPITFGELFEAICEYADVEYQSNVFINSTAVITSEPDEFENTTMRQVMQWIAEAGASNLRFNRDGLLVFDWIRSTEQTFDENAYIEYSPYWYETTQVDKLYNRTTSGGADRTVGNGEVGYLIQDNPLLKGVS